jgi:polysaccharide pyruvyl transferase WcaK-like protein
MDARSGSEHGGKQKEKDRMETGTDSLNNVAPRVLLFGYNGANNTGAEALLLSDIADVRAVLGPRARITVPTLNEANLRRYLSEGPCLDIAPIPSLFYPAIHKLVKEHDLVMLVEGSTYMDTWASALLWAYLWATRCADEMSKPCLTYAVDAGEVRSPLNRRLVRSEASRTDLIIVRAQAAAERLRSFGVSAPIEVTADNAFTFHPEKADEGWVQRAWPEAAAGRGIAGLAVVDPYLWPVVMRPWGRREDCYKWPYYYTRSPERARATEALVRSYAVLADALIVEHGKTVALICMEQLDETIARQVQGRMAHADQARVFSACEHNASQMTVLLRSLDVLVTSRYHACVLSLAAQVPQMAVGHDLRLKTIYAELGLRDHYFLGPRDPNLYPLLKERVEDLIAHPEPVRDLLRRGYEAHAVQAGRNRELLRRFVEARGWRIAA